MVRILPDPLASLDGWIARQDVPVTRPEAIRRLIELGLEATKSSVSPRPRSSSTGATS